MYDTVVKHLRFAQHHNVLLSMNVNIFLHYDALSLQFSILIVDF